METPTISIDVSEVFDVQAIDFLDNLLRYDHQDRLTAREAMVRLKPKKRLLVILMFLFLFYSVFSISVYHLLLSFYEAHYPIYTLI